MKIYFFILSIFAVLSIITQCTSAYPLEITNIKPQGTGDIPISQYNRIFRAYPGIVYNIRPSVIGGLYPYTFSLENAPSGMSINTTTGEITWTPSQSLEGTVAGPITLTVRDSEGNEANTSWSINITKQDFYFVDSSVPDGGDGSIENPWNGWEDFYFGINDETYDGAIKYFKNGTYHLPSQYASGEAVGSKRLYLRHHPRAYIAYPGDTVYFDEGYPSDPIHLIPDYNSNYYFEGIHFINGYSYGIENWAGNYLTFRRCVFSNFTTTDGYFGNQAAISIRSDAVYDDGHQHYEPPPDASAFKNYLVVQECVFENLSLIVSGIETYGIRKALFEDNHFRNITNHGILLKSTTNHTTIRRNIFESGSETSVGIYGQAYSNENDVSFNLMKSPLRVGGSEGDSGPGNTYIYRNTILGELQFRFIGEDDGPIYIHDNVIVNSNPPDHIMDEVGEHWSISANRSVLSNNLMGSPDDGITDSNGHLIGQYVSYIGKAGWEVSRNTPICEASQGHHCWYVAPWGNDSNDGSFEKPFHSIQKGVDSMQAGDYLYLRNGTYHEIGIYLGSNFWSGRSNAWYTIKSYPGEWAVVDGQHNISNNVVQEEVNSWGEELNVFRGTSQGGRMGYIKFENMEITGGGLDIDDPQYPVSGAAINIRGGPFVFRRLYIHDNYGKDNNNAAGLRLGNGVCNSIIEYCHFKANSQVKDDPNEPGVRTTSIANVLIFADYAYENPVTLYREDTGYCTATFGNEIRYNLFEADSGREDIFTNVGFKQKGMQRLTGYTYADQQNPADAPPNNDSFMSLGDKIHHNIFINHTVGIEIDQDYAQVYNNILVMKKRPGPNNAIQGRDENSDRRGPFDLVVYNNLIKGNGVKGIVHHPVPDGWSGDVPYVKAYIYNNILDNVSGDYDSEDISVESDQVSASGGYPLQDIKLSRNYFYNPPDSKIIYIYHTKYNKTEIEATPSADMVFVSHSSPDNPLYITAGDYAIKIRQDHVLGNGKISNAGIGGPHPYLDGVTLPSYIGPCPDSNCSWVDEVLSLSDISNLMEHTKTENQCFSADTNCNGRIEISELVLFIKKWKLHNIDIREVIETIRMWKNAE